MPKLNQFNYCTAQDRAGAFCDAPAIEDAPFPICIFHASQVMHFVRGYLRDFEQLPSELRLIMMDKTRVEENRRREAADKAREPHEYVYYVLVGKLVKIGYTSRLKQRLSSYPPGTRILAYERGGMNLEAQRHREFAAHLKHGNEWFAPAKPVIDHINEVRKQAGSPPLRGVA